MGGAAVSVVVGAVLAVLAGLGLTSVAGGTPAPVTAPYVVYGTV